MRKAAIACLLAVFCLPTASFSTSEQGMEGIEKALAELKAIAEKNGRAIAELSGQVAELRSQVEENSRAIAKLGGQVAELSDRAVKNSEAIARLNGETSLLVKLVIALIAVIIGGLFTAYAAIFAWAKPRIKKESPKSTAEA